LKKALAKTVTKIYMNTGIFTEFQRALPETVIKKSKSFKQANFLRGFARPNDQTKGKVVVADLGFCAEDSMVDEKENSDNPTAM
jgi:Cft2 family RNA processing exonuclease